MPRRVVPRRYKLNFILMTRQSGTARRGNATYCEPSLSLSSKLTPPLTFMHLSSPSCKFFYSFVQFFKLSSLNSVSTVLTHQLLSRFSKFMTTSSNFRDPLHLPPSSTPVCVCVTAQVLERRYIQNPDYSRYEDRQAASIAWSLHKKRNDSIIVDLFQVCRPPECCQLV